jgi:hypothetical protein
MFVFNIIFINQFQTYFVIEYYYTCIFQTLYTIHYKFNDSKIALTIRLEKVWLYFFAFMCSLYDFIKVHLSLNIFFFILDYAFTHYLILTIIYVLNLIWVYLWISRPSKSTNGSSYFYFYEPKRL